MTERTRQILEQALQLPLTERAVLVAELAASVEADQDPADVDRAWLVEIERRARAALRGEGKSSTWDEVEARVRARLRDRK